jgi:hypothetical protein
MLTLLGLPPRLPPNLLPMPLGQDVINTAMPQRPKTNFNLAIIYMFFSTEFEKQSYKIQAICSKLT